MKAFSLKGKDKKKGRAFDDRDATQGPTDQIVVRGKRVVSSEHKDPSEPDSKHLRVIPEPPKWKIRDVQVDDLDTESITTSEKEAYDRDLSVLPDAPGADVYARVPVAGFGEALLRGMGWSGVKDEHKLTGQSATSTNNESGNSHNAAPRPSLLGLGAKPVEGLKPERDYVPLKRV